jgi:hypothetical protein
MKITKALLELGYSEFVVKGDVYEGIEWVVEPETIPSKEEVESMALQIDDILETRTQEQRALKVSAYTKLGLTEDEINAIIGAQ